MKVDDFRPARYADHALFGRVGAAFAWLILGVCAAGAACVRFRHAPVVRALSVRMVDLLRPSDWAWIFLGGIVFPLLWYAAVSRLSPISAREWSPTAVVFLQPASEMGSMVLAMLILPVVLGNWRLKRRGAALGLAKPRLWPGWVAAAAALVGVLVSGTVMIMQPLLVIGVLAISGMWLVVALVWLLAAPRSQVLRHDTLARIVWPTWVFGMLWLALSGPLQYAEERHWIQRDRVMEVSAEKPALSGYEYDVAQILRTEVQEMIAEIDRLR